MKLYNKEIIKLIYNKIMLKTRSNLIIFYFYIHNFYFYFLNIFSGFLNIFLKYYNFYQNVYFILDK